MDQIKNKGGRPKGSTKRVGDLAGRYGLQLIRLLDQYLTSGNPQLEQFAMTYLRKHVFMELPAKVEVDSKVTVAVTAEQVRRMPQYMLDRIVAGEPLEQVLADVRN